MLSLACCRRGNYSLTTKVIAEGEEPVADIIDFTVQDKVVVVYKDGDDNLYVQVSAGKYLKLSYVDSVWELTEISASDWQNASLSSSGYLFAENDYSGDGFKDFTISSGDGTINISVEQTSAGYAVVLPKVFAVDIANLDPKDNSYQINWSSNSASASFELREEIDGVWGKHPGYGQRPKRKPRK